MLALLVSTEAPPRTSTELAALWKLALPLALAQAGQSLMGLIDTAFMGRLSAVEQGAAGLGNSLTFTFLYLGMGVMMSLDPLVSQAVGAGDQAKARGYYWQGVWLALFASVGIALVLLFVPAALRAAGVQPDIVPGAWEYILWRLPGLPATLLFVGARSYLQGIGRPGVLFVAMVIVNVVHVELDFILIFGAGPIPPLGIAGAALATTLSVWLQFWLLTRELGPSPEGVQRRPDREALRFAATVGAPIGLHFLVESGIFSLAGVLAARLSGPAVAAHQIALNWASLTFCVAAGIGSAATVRVGWGIGARDTPAARRAGLLAFWSGGLFMTASALMFLLVPEPLARLMTDKPEVIATVTSLFTVTAFFQIFDGVQVVGAGALRGAGDTRFPFLANLLGHWAIGLPVAWYLGVRGSLGVVGLWWGLCVGLMAVGVAVLVRFVRLTSKEVRALERHGPGAPPSTAGA